MPGIIVCRVASPSLCVASHVKRGTRRLRVSFLRQRRSGSTVLRILRPDGGARSSRENRGTRAWIHVHDAARQGCEKAAGPP